MFQFLNIYGDFQICISVPLSFYESFFHNIFFSYVISILKRSSSRFFFDFNASIFVGMTGLILNSKMNFLQPN